MDMAVQLAKTSEKSFNAQIAAVIAIRGKFISVGFNQQKTHPLQKKYGKNTHAVFLHAEIDAIRNALKTLDVDDLSKASIYVARVKKQPNIQGFHLGNAKPCQGDHVNCGCQAALESFGINRVFFTTDEGSYQKL